MTNMGVQEIMRSLTKHTEDMILRFGDKFEEYLDDKNERYRHVWRIILNFPLVLFMYAWMELAPYSDYWILDVPLLVIRYIGFFCLTGMFSSCVGPTLLLHLGFTLALSMVWLSQHVYWLARSRLNELCYPEAPYSCGDHTTSFWFPTIGACILQVTCTFYISWNSHEEQIVFQKVCALITIIVSAMATMFGSVFFTEITYWWCAFLLIYAFSIQVDTCNKLDESLDGRHMRAFERELKNTSCKRRQTELTHKISYLAQKIAARSNKFGMTLEFSKFRLNVFKEDMLIFILLFILEETIRTLSTYGSTTPEQSVVEVAIKVLSSCCTNAVQVWALSMLLGKFANDMVYVINNILNIPQHMLVVTNYQLDTFLIIAFLEANVITIDNQTRQSNLKGVLILAFLQVFIHVLNRVQNEILAIVNSAANISWTVSFRLVMTLVAIVIIPYLLTSMAFESLGVSKWSLFNASGMYLILVRVSMLVMECLLIWLCWRMPQQQERLERWLVKIRVIKSFGVCFAMSLQMYYRLLQPFLKNFFWFRLVLNIFQFAIIVITFCSLEWVKYQKRNQCLFMLDSLPEMNMTNTADAVNECAICYGTLYKGKQLPCKHVFHYDCLRRWFQIRTVCPLCNSKIEAPVNTMVSDFMTKLKAKFDIHVVA